MLAELFWVKVSKWSWQKKSTLISCGVRSEIINIFSILWELECPLWDFFHISDLDPCKKSPTYLNWWTEHRKDINGKYITFAIAMAAMSSPKSRNKVGCCFWCAIAWSIQLILLLLPGFSYCPSDNPQPWLFHWGSLIYKISIERLQFHICEMADNVY